MRQHAADHRHCATRPTLGVGRRSRSKPDISTGRKESDAGRKPASDWSISETYQPAYQSAEAAGKLLAHSRNTLAAPMTLASVLVGTLSFASKDTEQKNPLSSLESAASASFLIADGGTASLGWGSGVVNSSLSVGVGSALATLSGCAGVVASGVDLVKAAEYAVDKDFTLAGLSASSALATSLVAFGGGPVAAGLGAAIALGCGLATLKVKDRRSDLRHDRLYQTSFAQLPRERDDLTFGVLAASARELEMDPVELIDRVLDLDEVQVRHLIETTHQVFAGQSGPVAGETVATYLEALVNLLEEEKSASPDAAPTP